jgi:hypothetical protein
MREVRDRGIGKPEDHLIACPKQHNSTDPPIATTTVL